MRGIVRCAVVFCAIVALCLSGCERPGCEDATLCVEQCFTAVFRQCSGCPAGSFPEALCDRQSVCVREVVGDRELPRPPGTCDDASCTEGDDGRCLVTPSGELCSYDACEADTDCAVAGERCACSAGILEAHVCVPASCASPEDCGDFPCSPGPGCGGPNDPENAGPIALACHGPDDECFVDRQCTEGTFCAPGVDGR
jgi:hypothetical protein